MYQGFTNWDSYICWLHLADGDESLRQQVKDFFYQEKKQDSVSLGFALKKLLEKDVERTSMPFIYKDMINGVIANANWREIGEHLISRFTS